MNDEIREILDNPKTLQLSYGNYASLDDYFKLRDYITNLQQENEDYKSRVEKAVEYIKNESYLEEGYMIPVVEEKPLLNILQNGGEK